MSDFLDSGPSDSRPWQGFGDTHKIIALYLAYTSPPVLLDTIISISGLSPVTALNVMENFKNHGLVSEKKQTGIGAYFPDSVNLKEFIRHHIEITASYDLIKTVISYIDLNHEEGETKSLALAKFYLRLDNTEDGTAYIKKAADILNRSGEKKKATHYYDIIISQYNRTWTKKEPAQFITEIYLDSVYQRVTMGVAYPMAMGKILSLLETAHNVAKRFKDPSCLAKIKIFFAFTLLNNGKMRTAARLINEFWEIHGEVSDETDLKKAFFLASITIAMKGRYSEATSYYKKLVGNLQEFGDDEDDLLANLLIGFCQVSCGQISRGMGMIDAVRDKAKLTNFSQVVIRADFMSAISLIQIKRISEAETYIDRLWSMPKDVIGPYHTYSLHFCKAYILSTKESYEEAFSFLRKALELREASDLGGEPGLDPFCPWVFECLYTLESKGFVDERVYLDSEIEVAIGLANLCMKGAAYRYRALRKMDRGKPANAILGDLKQSENFLKQSGAEIELARTRTAMRNFYLGQGDHELADNCMEKTRHFLIRIDKSLFPKDLLDSIPWERKIDLVAERTTAINRSLGTVRDQSTLLKMMIHVAMDVTSAMQGCFFIHDQGELKLLASRNIVISPFFDEKFSPVRKAITDSIKKNKELFLPDGDNQLAKQFENLGIRSFISIPVRIDKEVCGCLSLGNHFGGSPFSESILPFVRMFASQIELSLSYFKAYEEIRKIKDRFKDETTFYRREMGLELPIEQIVGKTKGIRKVIEQIRQVAPTDSLVLITGETGVGKELVAKAIHNLSERKDGPFIPVNLATFPQDLIASELFGHEKGAFSGAAEKKKGRFELANNGTIFLDEIGDLSLDIQVKLLRVLQEGTFERLGGGKPIQSNFRVVTATNKNLKHEVKNGTFRQDFYYRLNVFPIHVPPLRERKEDIEMIARHFFNMFDKKLEKNIKRLPAGELNKLMSYHWPGNVRELKHFIERAVILSNGYDISFSGLEAEKPSKPAKTSRPIVTLAEAEREHIMSALESTFWRISGADGTAALLGLPPSTLRNRMKKLGIGRSLKAKGI